MKCTRLLTALSASLDVYTAVWSEVTQLCNVRADLGSWRQRGRGRRAHGCPPGSETRNLYEMSCSASNSLQYILVSCHGSLTLGTSGLQHTPYSCSMLQTACVFKPWIAEIECLMLWVLTQCLWATPCPGDPWTLFIDAGNWCCHGQG